MGQEDRRAIRWEVGLRYRPAWAGETKREKDGPPRQLALPLPVEQDMAKLPEQSDWEQMEGEYRTLGVYPEGHLMAHLRPRLGKGFVTSKEVMEMADGKAAKVAGIVIRRQRPYTKSGVVFVSLEDEFGHVPLMVWPKMYERFRAQFRSPVVMVSGTVSRRDGTMNLIVYHVEAATATHHPPRSKDWC